MVQGMENKKTNILNSIFSSERPHKCEWAVTAVLLAVIFFTLYYGDNIGMFLVYFWNNHGLLTGQNLNALGSNQLSYGIVQQIICEIWTLPANIVYLIHWYEVANTITVLWYKLGVAIVFCFSLKELKKLAHNLGIEKNDIEWGSLMLLSTILVALPVFHIAQTDSLYIWFLLIAFNSYFDKNRRRMLIFFALAVSCKYLAVFAIIPFIALTEKRIIYIFRDALVSMILVPIQYVWYRIIQILNLRLFDFGQIMVDKEVTSTDSVGNAVTSTVQMTQNEANVGSISHFFHKTLFFEIPAIHKDSYASLLVVIFVLFCIWCYIQNPKEGTDDTERQLWNYKCIYVISMSWLIYFCLGSPNPYWIVDMYPFMILMILMRKDRLKVNLILENLYTLTLFLVYIVRFGHVYGGSSNLDYLLLQGLKKGVYDGAEGPQVYGYLKRFGIDDVMGIVVAVCLASAIGMVIVNYPKTKIDEGLSDDNRVRVLHGNVLWQIAVLAVWYVICVWAVSSW